MKREEIANLLASILDKEFENLDIPTASDWERIEKKYKCKFPMEFRFFIDLMSEYSFPGGILNVSHGKKNGNDTIEFTYDYEMKQGGWKEKLIPFYSVGNGDYFCLLSNECPNSGVYYYSHEHNNIEKDADNFEEWLNQLPNFLS
ncbi:SMI1/KNR4 family protein [Solibacillus cecembensis]|uniref:SMI1/KNR4 family protein n=1 Tax=Solibacillus cecembensis TaxID=459347 RepID=UPI003D008AA1